MLILYINQLHKYLEFKTPDSTLKAKFLSTSETQLLQIYHEHKATHE